MRHLWSLLAGIVVAPLTWCLIALGQNGSQDTVGDWVSTRRWDTADLIEPAAYLVVAGILLGLVATLRISPVGPLVGGLLLVAAYVGMFIAPLDMRRAVPDDWEVLDRHLPLRAPLDNGTLALVGVLLVMAVFSANRWRRWPATAEAAAPPITPEATSPPTEPVGEAVTTPSPSSENPGTAKEEPEKPEKEAVPVGAESVTEEKKTSPATAPTEASTESPWSAPPGHSRPEKS